jgi:FKBP-type peptidyl-prolyl cis-trans isomerase
MKLLTSVIIIVIVAGVGLYFLKKEVKKSDSVVADQTSKEDITNNPSVDEEKPMDTNKKMLENFTPIAKVDALQKIDIKVGTGKVVEAGATVSVHYTGAVAATGVIFQSSKDFGTNPVTFPLNGVIKGWTDGIPGMKVGGTRRLVIPAEQAYGANPPAGSGIPANADLVFDVELVSVQ